MTSEKTVLASDSLRWRILGIALIAVLGIAAFLALMLMQSTRTATMLDVIRDRHHPVQVQLIKAAHTLEYLHTQSINAVLSSDTDGLSRVAVLSAEFELAMMKAANLNNDIYSEAFSIMELFRVYFRDAYQLGIRLVDTSELGASAQIQFNTTSAAYEPVRQKMDSLLAAQSLDFELSLKAAAQNARRHSQIALAAGTLIAALVLLLGHLTGNSILRRIRAMVDSLRQIAVANGNMSVRIPVTGSDEMAQLAYWFNTFLTQLEQVTEASTSEVFHMAYTDTLTGLPNRRMFMRSLEAEIARCRRSPGTQLAVMFLDLDDFKVINDQLGHEAGDELIREVGNRLEQTIRMGDVLCGPDGMPVVGGGQSLAARLAGDEFMLIITDLHEEADAVSVAERILKSIISPYFIEQYQFFVGVSIGIALYPHTAEDVDELIMRADTAMYQAKKDGKNTYRFFDTQIEQSTRRNSIIESMVTNELDDSGMRLVFQPQYCLTTGVVIGAEALLRWRNYALGAVSPAELLSSAERTGKLFEIDRWVLSQIAFKIAQWRREAGLTVKLSANLSAQSAVKSDLVEQVSTLLERYELAPNWLELEIKEGSALSDVNVVAKNIEGLRALGINIAVDDFGSAHSSLQLLAQCDVTGLKLDQNLIRGIHLNKRRQRVVGGLIATAHDLGISTLAEGLQSEEQIDALMQLGCRYGQGYLLSAPLEEEAFLALFSSASNKLKYFDH